MIPVGNYLPTLLVVLALVAVGGCEHRLKIVAPKGLVQLMPHAIVLHASAIGQTPAHSAITGLLSIGMPVDGCSELTPRSRPDWNMSSAYLHDFVLLSSQNCATSTKASNVYAMGGYAAIITKDSATQIDRHGTKVNIPVMQISESDSAKIAAYQLANPAEYIMASLEFNHIHKFNGTTVEIWLSSSDKEAYSFINNFTDFVNSKDSKVTLVPRFFTAELNQPVDEEAELARYVGCLSSGRYCAPELQYQSRLEGKQVVEQDIRQLVILKTTDKYWDYCQYWASECLTPGKIFQNHGDAYECSKKCMLRVGLDPITIQQRYLDSFRGPMPDINDNQYLLEQRQLQLQEKVDEHPQVLINGRAPKVTVRMKQKQKQKIGSLSDSVKYEICKRQTPDYSAACQSFSQDFVPFTSTVGWVITLTIILLLAFMAMSLIVYKCIMRHRMKREIKGEVFRTLEQYYHYSKVHGKLNKENEMEEIRKDEVRDTKREE